jgi:membrane protease YdiL (CAAX protease family)
MKLSPTLLRVLGYVRQPVYYDSNVTVVSPFKTFWELFKVNLWSMFGLFVLVFISLFIIALTGIEMPDNVVSKEKWIYAFALVIAAPLIEELVFRLPLRYSNKRTMMAGTVLFWAFYSETYEIRAFDKTIFWVVFFVGTITVLLLISYYRIQISAFWVANFKWIYWILASVFGLIHLGNYDGSWSSFMIFWPVLCIHQAVGGLLHGYARMRYGFWYGVALHATNNAIPAVFLVITLLTEK